MSNARRILVAGEDPAVRKSVEDALTGKGYAVVAVESGEEALWELNNGRYDAVFTDLVMRGISGLELAEEMHARQPRLPMVIITDHGAGVQGRAAAAGVAEWLHKPLAPAELEAAAERLLRVADSGAALQSAIPVAAAQTGSKPGSRLKAIVLFLLAPFIGIFYIIIFPVIGLGMLAIMLLSPGAQAPEQAESPLAPPPGVLKVLKTIGLMLVTAVVGIAYAVVAPILGIGVLLWFSFQAWGRLGAKAMKS